MISRIGFIFILIILILIIIGIYYKFDYFTYNSFKTTFFISVLIITLAVFFDLLNSIHETKKKLIEKNTYNYNNKIDVIRKIRNNNDFYYYNNDIQDDRTNTNKRIVNKIKNMDYWHNKALNNVVKLKKDFHIDPTIYSKIDKQILSDKYDDYK